MSDQVPSGPSALAPWQERRVGMGSARPLSLLLLPDAAVTRQPITYALLAAPELCRNAAGAPVFSLTLVLKRRPGPHEENLAPLIQSGALALEITLGAPEWARREIERADGAEARPVFARSANCALYDERASEPGSLTQATSSGAAVRFALQAALDQAQALDALRSLDGRASALRVNGEVSFRAVSPTTTLWLKGSWAEVHDFLTMRVDAHGEMSGVELRRAFDEMLNAGTLAVYAEAPAGAADQLAGVEAGAMWRGFLQTSIVIIERLTTGLALDDQQNQFRLRRRPHPAFNINYAMTASVAAQRSVAFAARLEEIIGGALDGLERGRFIHLVCPTSGGGGMAEAPPRLRSGPSGSRGGQASARWELSAMEGGVKSVAVALSPSLTGVSALATANVARPEFRPHWFLDDLALAGSDRQRNLPVVENAADPLWQDRLDKTLYWYAPAFELVQPASNASADASPFLFSFRRAGATADGKPALAGKIRFTLRRKMSAATQVAAKRLGNVRLRPLPASQLTVMLAAPYVDARDGAPRTNLLQARLSEAGETITATVELLNESVRLCYGALATPGFQAEPARLHVAYTFESYTPLQPGSLAIVAGGKVAATPIALAARDAAALAGRPHFNAVTSTFHYAGGEFKLEREAPRGAPPPAPPRITPASPLVMHATAPAATALSHAGTAPPVIVKPPISLVDALGRILRKTQYATRTLARQERVTRSCPATGWGPFMLRRRTAARKPSAVRTRSNSAKPICGNMLKCRS